VRDHSVVEQHHGLKVPPVKLIQGSREDSAGLVGARDSRSGNEKLFFERFCRSDPTSLQFTGELIREVSPISNHRPPGCAVRPKDFVASRLPDAGGLLHRL